VSAAADSGAAGLTRLDRWLWAVRVFKTRPLATDACRLGRVKVNGLPAKPAREVHAGEIIAVRLELMTRTLRFVAAPRSRVGAKALPEFCEELTPAAEFEKVREHHAQRALREPGSGRPTKRDRRLLDRLLG
jgi:ribosome-associated heat shock protein Hsp15